MRTIRIKLYKFEELSENAQEKALTNSHYLFMERYPNNNNWLLLSQKEKKERIIALELEFTQDGRLA